MYFGELTVPLPSGTLESAAGSSYDTAPVTIMSTCMGGRPVRIEGEVVLRRVDDFSAVKVAQRRCRMGRLTFYLIH